MPADDVDLGELGRESSDQRPPEAGARHAPTYWRSAAVAVGASLVVGAVAWQLGAQRARDEVGPQLPTGPAVLAWLSNAEPPSATHEQVVVRLTNLSPSSIRVEGVVSSAGTSGSGLSAALQGAVSVEPARTGSVVVTLAAECRNRYSGASIALRVGYPDPVRPGTTRHVLVSVTDGPLVGPSYTTMLNRMCSRTVRFNQIVRASGVSVELPDVAQDAEELLLTNHAHTARAVQIVATGAGRFTMVSSPALPLLLAPGEQRTVRLRIRVGSCQELALGPAWADALQLQVTPVGSDPRQPDVQEDSDDPTALGLFEAVFPILDAARTSNAHASTGESLAFRLRFMRAKVVAASTIEP